MGLIEPQFFYHHLSGGPTRKQLLVLDGCIWVLHPVAPWRDLPERFSL
ncbi:hypothetical protein C5B76_07180 [Aeromonas salmonicida]|nr:hypothetical protein C5B76_07180 [Aeromonas salmonicida]